MAWLKLVLIACFWVTECHGLYPIKLSKLDFHPIPAFLNNSEAGAWNCFKNLTNVQRGNKMKDMPNLKQYLQKFGYLTAPEGHDMTEDFDDLVANAVKMYQRNEATVSLMMTPRCGQEDVINGTSVMWRNTGSGHAPNGLIHVVKHYNLFQGSPRWSVSKRNLTYAFDPEHNVTEITVADMRTVFGLAFQRWANVTNLTFTVTDDYANANIKIGFFSGNHGDGHPFDGPLATTAHSYSPGDGRCHLDAAETWTVDLAHEPSSRAMDLESIATHEIGHLLGLQHTNVTEAVMYPMLPARFRKVNLTEDDVKGVQSLYGRKY